MYTYIYIYMYIHRHTWKGKPVPLQEVYNGRLDVHSPEEYNHGPQAGPATVARCTGAIEDKVEVGTPGIRQQNCL